jgi:hypothetical protein
VDNRQDFGFCPRVGEGSQGLRKVLSLEKAYNYELEAGGKVLCNHAFGVTLHDGFDMLTQKTPLYAPSRRT